MSKAMYYKKPALLEVLSDPHRKGKLLARTPWFDLANLNPTKLDPLIASLRGYDGNLQLRVTTGKADRDTRLADEITRLLEGQQFKQLYNTPNYEPYENWYENFDLLTTVDSIFDLDSLDPVLRGRRVLYCGAGPSLAEYKDTIQQAIETGSAIVIAGGSAIRVFAEWGLRPHYCLAIDPVRMEWQAVFKDLPDEWIAGQNLITAMTLYPPCLWKWVKAGGNLTMLGGVQSLQLFSYFDGLRPCYMGLTVSTCMMHLAAECGVGALYMAGVDLAYGETEYADGRTVSDISKAIDHNGHSTRKNWIIEARYLSHKAQLKELKAVYRLGQAGLPIDGIPRLDEMPQYESAYQLTMRPSIAFNIEQMRQRMKGTYETLVELQGDDVVESSDIYDQLFEPYYELQYSYQMMGVPINVWLLRAVRDFHFNKLKEVLYDLEEVRSAHQRQPAENA